MLGPPRIRTEDHGLVILKLSVGLGRYCAELQHGTVWGPCLGTLQLQLPGCAGNCIGSITSRCSGK